MPEEIKTLLVRPMACRPMAFIKDIMRLGWMLCKRSLRLEVV